MSDFTIIYETVAPAFVAPSIAVIFPISIRPETSTSWAFFRWIFPDVREKLNFSITFAHISSSSLHLFMSFIKIENVCIKSYGTTPQTMANLHTWCWLDKKDNSKLSFSVEKCIICKSLKSDIVWCKEYKIFLIIQSIPFHKQWQEKGKVQWMAASYPILSDINMYKVERWIWETEWMTQPHLQPNIIMNETAFCIFPFAD